MASGSIYGITSNKYITVRVDWTSIPDQPTNTSIVYARLFASKSRKSSSPTKATGSWSINIAGTVTTIKQYLDLKNDDSWQEIGVGQGTVVHDRDGTKSIQILASGSIPNTTWTSTNLSGVAVLDTIPRETSPTFDSMTCDFGAVLPINLIPYDDRFTHDVFIQWQNGEPIKIAENAPRGVVSYTIPTEWMNAIPNDTRSSFRVLVDTFLDGDLLGSTVTLIEATVPASVVPVIESITVSDVGGLVPEAWGVLVENKSTLHVLGASRGVYGSTITGYTIEALDQSIPENDVDVGLIDRHGTIEIAVIATDSRGRSARATVTRDVLEYASPTISNFKVTRANNQGVTVDNGTYLKVTMSAAITDLIGRNAMTIEIYHQRSDVETRTLARRINPSDLSVSDAIYLVGNMEPSRSYEITVEVSDFFADPTRATAILPSEGGVISWMDGARGIAFGKAAEEEDHADFAWRIHGREGMDLDDPLSIESGGTGATTAHEAVENLGAAHAKHSHEIADLPSASIVDLIYPVGSLYLTTSSANPSTIFEGTTWEQIKDRFILAAGDTYANEAKGGAASQEIPDHTHVSPIGTRVNDTAIAINGARRGSGSQGFSGTGAFWSGQRLTGNFSDVSVFNTSAGGAHTVDTIPPYLAVMVWIRKS